MKMKSEKKFEFFRLQFVKTLFPKTICGVIFQNTSGPKSLI